MANRVKPPPTRLAITGGLPCFDRFSSAAERDSGLALNCLQLQRSVEVAVRTSQLGCSGDWVSTTSRCLQRVRVEVHHTFSTGGFSLGHSAAGCKRRVLATGLRAQARAHPPPRTRLCLAVCCVRAHASGNTPCTHRAARTSPRPSRRVRPPRRNATPTRKFPASSTWSAALSRRQHCC